MLLRTTIPVILVDTMITQDITTTLDTVEEAVEVTLIPAEAVMLLKHLLKHM